MIRQALSIALSVVFLYQAFWSLTKYLDKSTSTTVRDVDVDKLAFPSISFCPVFNLFSDAADTFELIGVVNDSNETFAEAYAGMSVLGRLLSGFAHERVAKEFKTLNTSSLPEGWSAMITATPHGNLAECLTYEPKGEYLLGFVSRITLIFDLISQDESVYAFVSPARLKHLFPTRQFGSDVFKTPAIRANSLSLYQMEIIVSEKRVLSTKESPCRDEDEDEDQESLLDCIEADFERKNNCSLLWREEGSYQRRCDTKKDLMAFKLLYANLLIMSENKIFATHGCAKPCTYKDYKIKTALKEDKDFDTAPDRPYNLMVWFYLASGGLRLEQEILVYDLLDLIGNVGGYLGLYLGLSMLAIYDDVKLKVGRIKEMARAKANIVP